MNEVTAQITTDEKIDLIEAAIINSDHLIDCPLVHDWADNMYIREIFMPKGTDEMPNFVTSMIHNSRHPFFILKGKVAVYSDNDGEEILEAGYRGITKPNTRRVLRIIEDVTWVTCHSTDIKPKDDSKESIDDAVRLIMEKIIDKRVNPLLEGRFENNVLIPFTVEELKNNQELISSKNTSHEF